MKKVEKMDTRWLIIVNWKVIEFCLYLKSYFLIKCIDLIIYTQSRKYSLIQRWSKSCFIYLALSFIIHFIFETNSFCYTPSESKSFLSFYPLGKSNRQHPLYLEKQIILDLTFLLMIKYNWCCRPTQQKLLNQEHPQRVRLWNF